MELIAAGNDAGLRQRYRDQITKELRNGFRQIYREQEERAIMRWLEQDRPDLLDAYIKELEALDEGFERNLDTN